MICTNQTSCISPSPPGTHFVVQDSGARRVCVSENRTDWLTRVPIVLNVLLAYLEDKLRIWKVGPWRPFFLCWWTKSQLSVFFLEAFPFLHSHQIHIKLEQNLNFPPNFSISSKSPASDHQNIRNRFKTVPDLAFSNDAVICMSFKQFYLLVNFQLGAHAEHLCPLINFCGFLSYQG